MNELFAADPHACATEGDLKLLLSRFGPYTGRYLAMYPLDWEAHLARNFPHLKVIEELRVRTLLRRAREQPAFLAKLSLSWNPSLDWLHNAAPLAKQPKTFDCLVANLDDDSATAATGALVYSVHDLVDVPPTAEERVLAKPNEFARVAKTLLLISHELSLIDPYLNPSKNKTASVLLELFKVAAKGKAKKLTLWSRYSEIVGSANPEVVLSDVERSLRQIVSKANFQSGRLIELVLVRDEDSVKKLHERYLLSIKGGVRFDQGFQQLPDGRRMTVSPISKIVHEEFLELFFEQMHGFYEVERLSVRVS